MGFYAANAKRTKRAIADAYIGLLEKKAFEKITIKDILTSAEINRSTFYKYFPDKYDLTKQILTALIDGYAQILIANRIKPAEEAFSYTYKFILENKHTFKALLSVRNHEIDGFIEIINGLCAIYPKVYVSRGKHEYIESHYFADIHFSAFYNLIINEDAPAGASNYMECITESLVNVFSDCFKIEPKELKGFIKINKRS